MSRIRENRRSEILLAAQREFCEKGLEAASISEIARRAGIGKSTIYEYFTSKDQLLEEVCRHLWQTVTSKIDASFSEEKTFHAKLVSYYHIIHDLMEELGVDLTVLFTASPIREVLCNSVEEFRQMIFERICRAVMQGQESGELRTDVDAQVITILLVTQITPFLMETLRLSERQESPEQIVDLLIKGICAA